FNPSEPSPLALYGRIFGPEFRDPNAATFTPDPGVIARQSVLSAVKDERLDIMGDLGASDRARLDEYFTSLRQLERQLELQTQRPDPLPACSMPDKVEEGAQGVDVAPAGLNSKLFGRLI